MNIDVIIPLHIIELGTKELLEKAINSVEESVNKIHIVCPQPVLSELSTLEFIKLNNRINLLLNDNKTDFSSQINFAISNIDSEFFSILEFDDEYVNNPFKNVQLYRNHYPEVDFYLPIILDVNSENIPMNFTNSAVWAVGFGEKLGYLDLDGIKNNGQFSLSGGIFNREKFIKVGGLKPSIKLSFNHEFLLRAVYNGTSIMVFPKICYKHMNGRVNSLFDMYQNHPFEKMTVDEAEFWMKMARTEYIWPKDRDYVYSVIS